jgi:AraC-like DNA-binding protein
MRHLRDDATDPAASVFVCGAYQFAGDVGLGLINALPQLIVLRAPDQDSLHDVIAALAAELVTTSPGQQTVLDRLLDVVLVLAIRAGLRQSDTAPGWYHALADPRLNAALEAIHNDPAHPWTVPELAAISGLSRATFARTFTRMLGQAPMQYLTDWRMTLARDLLRADNATLGQISTRIGYASPYAFAAAFQRHHGQPPGRWRRQQPAPPLSAPPSPALPARAATRQLG